MKSIVLVNVYFGPYNNYFNLFLLSCAKNPTVNFLLVTDNTISNIPKNVRVLNHNFQWFRDKVQSLYDFPISLKTPYEICDYKVIYGELFYEEIKNFDFWGFCDTDIIFGNIRKFITNEILEKYDKILIRGHFTLFRNNQKINLLYRSALNDGRLRYKEVFSDEDIHHFDEGMPDLLEGINCIFKQRLGWDKVYDKYLFLDLEVSSWNFINADFLDDDKEKQLSENSILLWSNGDLFRISLVDDIIIKQEYMYVHLQKRKMKIKRNMKIIHNKYLILPNAFIEYNQINNQLLKKANRKKIYWKKYIERLNNKIKRSLGELL